jgi:hypothetical protein
MAEKETKDEAQDLGGDLSPTGVNPRDMGDDPTSSLASGASASATRGRDNLGGGHGDGIKGVSHTGEMSTRSDTSAGSRSAIDTDDDDDRGNR